jgi:hypothetical protein
MPVGEARLSGDDVTEGFVLSQIFSASYKVRLLAEHTMDSHDTVFDHLIDIFLSHVIYIILFDL